MTIRTASISDLAALTAMEAACFPPAEAAPREVLAGRLAVYPNHFWLLEEGGMITGFLDGPVTNEPLLRDEMYGDPAFHDERGVWQMIFGVGVLPQHRKQGRAARLMEHAIAEARAQGRSGCVLTCKGKLRSYYEKFGYQSEGVSASVHGGAVWYDMRLSFFEK